MTIKEQIAELEEKMKKSYTGADIDRLKALKNSLAAQPIEKPKSEIPAVETPAPEKKKAVIKTKKAAKKRRK